MNTDPDSSPFSLSQHPTSDPHQAHPHRPKRQSQTTNRLTNPHSICTSTPSKERVQATNNRLPTNTQSVHPLPPKSVYKPTTTDSQPHPSCTSPPPEGLGEAVLFVNFFPFRFSIYALLRCKRRPFALQKMPFYIAKGHVLQRKRA